MTLCSFRVYPGRNTPPRYRLNKRHYFIVHVYKTRGEMYKARAKMRPEEQANNYAAIVMPMVTYHRKRGKWIAKDWKLGDALFCKSRTGVGLLSHEALHIALCFLRAVHNSRFKLGGEHIDDTEEELAYVLTTVVRQLVAAFFRYKIYE